MANVDTDALWRELEYAIHNCRKCDLGERRQNAVPGEGDRNAFIMFVGEGPGRDEDATGRPFVGLSGQLLDKMIAAIDLKREDVYIANVIKCRPPNNRTPSRGEIQVCLPYLRRQVYLIKPKIIICLGSPAARTIIDPDLKITRQRGQWIERKGYHIMATYHPAALLRDSSKKKDAWDDFKSLRDRYNELTEKMD